MSLPTKSAQCNNSAAATDAIIYLQTNPLACWYYNQDPVTKAMMLLLSTPGPSMKRNTKSAQRRCCYIHEDVPRQFTTPTTAHSHTSTRWIPSRWNIHTKSAQHHCCYLHKDVCQQSTSINHSWRHLLASTCITLHEESLLAEIFMLNQLSAIIITKIFLSNIRPQQPASFTYTLHEDISPTTSIVHTPLHKESFLTKILIPVFQHRKLSYLWTYFTHTHFDSNPILITFSTCMQTHLHQEYFYSSSLEHRPTRHMWPHFLTCTLRLYFYMNY